MAIRLLITAVVLCVSLTSCSSTQPALAGARTYRNGHVDNAKYYKVKTTAYSHVEADSLKYGRANASGGQLKYGSVRSAAADWSVFPLGTVFKIEGQPYYYQVDDYGSALVGTKTIDLYKPDKEGIRNWGARNVKIQVLKWGSYTRSMEVLRERTGYSHVRRMIQGIQRKI
jgi:3D (Asp-Asp-Asp) domain-containing protein